MAELEKFLDDLERRREAYQDRYKILTQCDGFRHDWANYMEEYEENFSMD